MNDPIMSSPKEAGPTHSRKPDRGFRNLVGELTPKDVIVCRPIRPYGEDGGA